MAGDRPARVAKGESRTPRVAAALTRVAAGNAGRRGIRGLLGRSSASAADAASAHPFAAAAAAGVVAAMMALLLVVAVLSAIVLGIASSAAAACKEQPAPTGTIQVSRGDPPRELIGWLVAAANQESAQLGPRGPAVLAGIAKKESDFGRSTARGVHSSVNFLGCCAGPFQFNLRDTWAAFADDPGADANGDRKVSVYSFADAAFAAARKLRSNGAPEDWKGALLRYNPSTAYVEDVLRLADDYQGPIVDSGVTAPEGGDEPAPALPPQCQDVPNSAMSLENAPTDAHARIRYIADWIEQQRYHYCYGGGHDPEPGPDATNKYCYDEKGKRVGGNDFAGIDCSGSVRLLLVKTGYPDPGGIVSGSFAGAYPSGPGRYVTIWSNDGHVFITIDGRDWGTSGSNYAHGPGWTSHPKDGFVMSHPPGL